MNIEEQIIYKAIQVLEEKTDLKGRWFAKLKDKTIDGNLELKNKLNKNTFPAIVKKEIKTTHLVSFSETKETFPDVIIVAETIFPKIREQLRKMGVNYIDIHGNCYITKNEWVYLVEGFKIEAPVILSKESAFTKTGLLLIFHFLNDERYLGVTYRQMAEDYGTALGNVNKIINSLKDQGYLLKLNKKELKLTRKKELLDEWIQAYEQKLKPALLIGNFRQLNGADKDWEKIPLNNIETQWGGEPAANLLTGYLKPGRLMLYTLETKPQLVKKYRLVPDEKGHLEIYRKFWKFNIATDTVPPMLVYADLINSGDPRNIETAKMLYNGLLED
jgi:hypothetical protein